MKNISIEIKNEKRIKKLLLFMMINYCYLYLYDLDMYIKSYWTSYFVEIFMDFVLVGVMLLISRKEHVLTRCKTNLKDKGQYILVVPIVALMFIPRIIVFGGFSGGSLMISGLKIFAEAMKYLLVIGVYEELVYRMYIQKELEELLGKAKIIAPILAAVYFGFIHTVQGTVNQAEMAFGLGLVLGYFMYFNKRCTFVTIALAHGIFDIISGLIMV